MQLGLKKICLYRNCGKTQLYTVFFFSFYKLKFSYFFNFKLLFYRIKGHAPKLYGGDLIRYVLCFCSTKSLSF